jgi:large subunit ribosomal protein L20
MPRVKRGTTTHKRHASLLERAKGFRNTRRTSIKRATEATLKAAQFAYRDRRTKKRDFRRSWIGRINAGVREHGLSYSQFINLLQASGSQLNRKTLSDMITTDKEAFAALVKEVTKK